MAWKWSKIDCLLIPIDFEFYEIFLYPWIKIMHHLAAANLFMILWSYSVDFSFSFILPISLEEIMIVKWAAKWFWKKKRNRRFASSLPFFFQNVMWGITQTIEDDEKKNREYIIRIKAHNIIKKVKMRVTRFQCDYGYTKFSHTLWQLNVNRINKTEWFPLVLKWLFLLFGNGTNY